MRYTEENKDLFASEDCYFVQCISADFAMGAGIAVKFNQVFDTKNKMIEKHGNYIGRWNDGTCVLCDRVYNLITKEKGYGKPTYATLQNALNSLKAQVLENPDCKTLAMPTIACGLDGLEWNRVSQMVQDTFADTDINISVCIPQRVISKSDVNLQKNKQQKEIEW